jgi:wobble nucleotide-excising tRNase
MNNLQTFGQFNLIYGWNGSGKTTLSSLFRNLQQRLTVVEGEVEFEIDCSNRISAHEDLSTVTLPTIRVFNRDFIESTIIAAGDLMEPIYYIGENAAEEIRQVDTLNNELGEVEQQVTSADAERRQAERNLDQFCIDKAKAIKELLINSVVTNFNNYDKAQFKQALEMLDKESVSSHLLSDEQKVVYRRQKDSQPKGNISNIECEDFDFQAFKNNVERLLSRPITSQIIQELVDYPEIGVWVQKGLILHTGQHESATCRFCDQNLPMERIQRLEAHFNDTLTAYQSELSHLSSQVKAQRQDLIEVKIPESSRLYDHLVKDMELVSNNARQLLEDASNYLELINNLLLRKKDAPFETITIEDDIDSISVPENTEIVKAIEEINAIVDKHNMTTVNFTEEIKTACKSLEQSYLAENFEEYHRLCESVNSAKTVSNELNNKKNEISENIKSIQSKIREHQRPAEELNKELSCYLGHSDLQLEVKELGYKLTRSGKPVTNLSEGEKTAIAFLYFLKALSDNSVDISKSIIVIDDPVSSLDSNSLFSAFSYMKEQTKDAGQLLIFTHNFTFFNLVKHWFHNLKYQRRKDLDQRPARFYMLKVKVMNGHRDAVLTAIDPLLEQYQSEYHYLFKCVLNVANQNNGEESLESYYGMPNVARRFMEAFTAFRYPDIRGDLYKKIGEIEFDEDKKTRILRFLNTYSHSETIAVTAHDPSLLSETKSVFQQLLELVQECDPEHFNRMVKICVSTEEENDDA